MNNYVWAFKKCLRFRRVCGTSPPHTLSSFKASPAGMSHVLLADLVKLIIV
ncbi:MAG TPA: hypothetical protein VL943_07635 [Niabella sp.]|nr:hypothetical protein [Niabella sp.]